MTNLQQEANELYPYADPGKYSLPQRAFMDYAAYSSRAAYLACAEKYTGVIHQKDEEIKRLRGMPGNQWVTDKPDLQRECLFATAILHKDKWGYDLWQIKKTETDEGWYYGLCTPDGVEWGPLEDLKADRYMILPEIIQTR